MIESLIEWMGTIRFIFREAIVGSRRYWFSILSMALVAAYGLYLWFFIQHGQVLFGLEMGGLIYTSMSDSVMWGMYISFFIFWVGVAAAGIVFGIAAYVFNVPSFKRIAVIGEAQAIMAIVIALLLVMVDIGRPIRAILLMPLLPNLRSMFDWDFLVLNGYLILNIIGYLYTIHNYRLDRSLSYRFTSIFITVAAPLAIGIHTVTAFISQALTARPIWNSPLLAPRYVATAFASGPAILLMTLYLASKYIDGFSLDKDMFKKTLYVIVSSLVIGLYFTLTEVQELFWYTTEPMKKSQALTLFLGVNQPWLGGLFWTWVILGSIAILLPIISSRYRDSIGGIIVVCIVTVIAVIAEKTFTIVLPAFIPDALGMVVGYFPSPLEIFITIGIHALGIMIFIVLVKTAIRAIIIHYGKGMH
jgi:molybdopterin-containing oxidoreductase family membrane subunit